MKVLLISKSDDGGAGRAAYRLHKGLQESGVDSQMLVESKSSDDQAVIGSQGFLPKLMSKLKLTNYLDGIPLQLNRKVERGNFSLELVNDPLGPQVAKINPDIVNLHWVSYGYLQIETLPKFKKPVVWTCHDMWSFTGGCHYSRQCERYINSCGACPELFSSKERDLSRWVWQRKAKAWKNLNLTIITPSVWLADCAKASSLFKNVRVEVIPNGIDLKKYKPFDRRVARDLLNLPQDKKLILFGAMDTTDRRKGFHLLQPALQSLSGAGFEADVVVFGASAPTKPNDFGLKAHYLGSLRDDVSIGLTYAAADVFVAPSTQENLPNTVMEAFACGTPSVAFKIGGLPDMIEHEKNGYLAKPYEIEDLARGIAWVLEDEDRHKKLCTAAREKATKEYSLELQASRYLSVFKELKSQFYR